MSTRHVIVDVCPVDHPEAKKLKEANENLGYRVFAYRGWFVIVLCEQG